MDCSDMQGKPKIGVLALTLEFYEQFGAESRLARQKWLVENVLPVLKEFAEVDFGEAVFTADAVAEEVDRLESSGCDMLVVICLTYAASGTVVPALAKTSLPILVWNTQELWAVSERYGAKELMANHGVHGTQDLGCVLLRQGIPFEYHTSHLHDDDPAVPIKDFAVAAAMVRRLKRARVGIIGYPFPNMDDFTVEHSYLNASLGVTCVDISLDEFFDRAAAVSMAEINALSEEYRSTYVIADDVTESELKAAAKYELTLRRIVADDTLDALTYQFLAFGEDAHSETLPFVAAARMMADGVGFAGEGDVVGTVGTWFLNGLCRPATFSEVFTIDFGGNAVLMSHMGEANVAMARTDGPVKLAVRSDNVVPTIQRQTALEVVIEPGPATFAALVQGPKNRWRFVVSRMQVIDFGPVATGLAAPHFKITPQSGNIRDWLTAYAKAGGPHHNALCFGDARRRLYLAAQHAGIEYVEV